MRTRPTKGESRRFVEFGSPGNPKGFLKGFLKPKTLRAEIEVDHRAALMGKKTDTEMAADLKTKKADWYKSVATLDGGTMWGTSKVFTVGSTTTGLTAPTGTGGTYIGTAMVGTATGSGWSAGMSSTAFGAFTRTGTWSFSDWFSQEEREMIQDVILDQVMSHLLV